MVVATTGFFDGVHRGHQAVLNIVTDLARENECKSVVFTFWPHPRTVLQQDAAKFRLLTSIEEKKRLILSLGIDSVEVLTFDKQFANHTTEEFYQDILINRFGITHLVIGYDHRVGRDLSQTQEQMIEIANGLGIKTYRVGEFAEEEIIVSSTKIRDYISKGEISKANHFLGYRYGLEGVVVEGQRIGRTIGFPTANIRLYEPLKMLPADGVYAVWAESSGRVFRGITNIGTRPTIAAGNERTIETHLLDFEEDIYGLSLKIEFVCKMRDEQAFASISDLRDQLLKDKERAMTILDFNNIVLR